MRGREGARIRGRVRGSEGWRDVKREGEEWREGG